MLVKYGRYVTFGYFLCKSHLQVLFKFPRTGCINRLYFRTALLMYDPLTIVQRASLFHSVVLIAMVSGEIDCCILQWPDSDVCSIGIEHNVDFVCCQCEPLVVTMVRARLWPSTPQRPQIAFTFDLLDWAETLLLECQVALKDLCTALYFKCPHLVVKVYLLLD